MSWGSEFVNHLSKGEHAAAQAVAHAAGAVGQTAWNLFTRGTPLGILATGLAAAGHMHGPSTPAGRVPIAPPSYMGSAPGAAAAIYGPMPGPLRPKDVKYGCQLDAAGNPLPGRRPFSFPMRVQFAGAGAIAAGDTATDFISTTACDQITTNGKFPNNFIAETAQLIIGSQVPASIVETDGVLAGLSVIEKHASAEVARYPLFTLFPFLGRQSLTTSGAASSGQKYDSVGVYFQQAYDPNTSYSLLLTNAKAFTPAAALDITLILTGTIKA